MAAKVLAANDEAGDQGPKNDDTSDNRPENNDKRPRDWWLATGVLGTGMLMMMNQDGDAKSGEPEDSN